MCLIGEAQSDWSSFWRALKLPNYNRVYFKGAGHQVVVLITRDRREFKNSQCASLVSAGRAGACSSPWTACTAVNVRKTSSFQSEWTTRRPGKVSCFRMCVIFTRCSEYVFPFTYAAHLFGYLQTVQCKATTLNNVVTAWTGIMYSCPFWWMISLFKTWRHKIKVTLT